MYSTMSTVYNAMYHIIMSTDIRDGRIFRPGCHIMILEWFTGTYLGVKMVHPRVSRSIRTQVKTSDTGYIQDSRYTIICQNPGPDPAS